MAPSKPVYGVHKTLTASHWGTYSVSKRLNGGLALEAFSEDPEPSLIGQALADSVRGELRIAQPMARASWLDTRDKSGEQRQRRGRDAFVPLSWTDASELVGKTLIEVIENHGNEAIFGGSYGWASAGRFHHAQGQLHRFLNGLGGYTSSVNTYSSGAAEVIVPHVLGHDYRTCNDNTTTWSMLAKHAELFVAFGGMAAKNAQVHPGGISRHHALAGMTACANGGTRFVNVSPVRSDMAESLNAQWLAIRPNTDTALMLALAHTLIVEGRVDEAFVHSHCVGFELVRDYLLGRSDGLAKSPEWAAALTEINAQKIRDLARQMADARTFISLSLSIQRGDHGEQTYWAGITLAALLGQIGLPGGGFGFSYGALGGIGNPRSAAKGPTFPQSSNPVMSFIPVARLSDMLLHPGEPFDYDGQTFNYPDIKLIYWAGGNPFHHQQDLTRLCRAWLKPETVIAHEIWWNPLARQADIVLPATTSLERNDIGFNSSDAYMIAMKQALAPVGEAKNDYEIFAGIAEQLGCRTEFTLDRSELEWLKTMYDDYAGRSPLELPEFAEFWEADYVQVPPEQVDKVFLSEFRANPIAHALPTPSGKIELFSSTIAAFDYSDCPGHACWLEPAEWLGHPQAQSYPLHLLSNQPAQRLHSQFDHSDFSRSSKVAGREPVRMNPQDAQARRLGDGDLVRVFNERGACLAGVIIDVALRPGVVQIATGAWFDPARADSGTFDLDRSGNPNMMTLDKGTSRLAQASLAQTALVEVELYSGGAAGVEAYDPPDITSPEGKAKS